jgi:hypothetical protein
VLGRQGCRQGCKQGSRAGGSASARALLAKHRVFAVAFAIGAALRVVAELGYPPALWFNDSFDYVAVALHLRPDPVRPIGYPLLLRLLEPSRSLALVTSLQHVLGLGCAVGIYAVLRARFHLPGWGATLAAAPVLFDAFQIQLEHLLLADVLFEFLAIAAIATVCWLPARSTRASVWRAALAGGLLAMAALTRPIAIPLIAIVLAYLAVRRAGWRVVAAAAAAACAPLAGYVLWFHAVYGQFALDSTDGVYLWGRTAAFADCATIKPPASEAWLCPRLPPAQRAASSSQVWQPTSPFHWQHGKVFTAAQNDLALRFALRAIAAQPGDYARTVLSSTGRSFTWGRTAYPTGYTTNLYTFAGAKTSLPTWPEPDGLSAAEVARAYADGNAATAVVAPYAGFLRWYQRYVYLRGTLLGLILLVPPAAGLGRLLVAARRARRRDRQSPRHPARPPRGTSHDRDATWICWLCWSAAVVLLLVPPMTVDFDYRYVLPVVPFACLAAALAGRRALVAVRLSRPNRTPWRRESPAAASIPTTHELTRSEG